MAKPLILGTRGSELALVQANATADAIRKKCPGTDVEILIIKTAGDIDRTTPFVGFGSTGLFVKEIEQQLIDSKIDLAVHSMKDVPTLMDERLTIGAVPKREDARDAGISKDGRKLADLPQGAIIGTSSPRRRAQILRQRPDVEVRELRGNVGTRLRKLDEGQYDLILLAVAGLTRLGLADRITQKFDFEQMLPAPGQGALAIQVRKNDPRTADVMKTLNLPNVAAATEAERMFLDKMGGGCQLPAGALATMDGDKLLLKGYISDSDGKQCFEGQLVGEASEPTALGITLAEKLIAQGASAII